MAAADELRAYMDKLVSAKESEPTDDLIGRQIVKHRAEGDEDHEALVSLALLLLIAGHETTANMISLGTVALLQPARPARGRCVADPARTLGAVEELLREFTIAEFVTSRVAVADTVVGGVEVKAGEGVVTLGNAANHDPAVFADAGPARHHARRPQPHRVRLRRAPVPRPEPGPGRAAGRVRHAVRAGADAAGRDADRRSWTSRTTRRSTACTASRSPGDVVTLSPWWRGSRPRPAGRGTAYAAHLRSRRNVHRAWENDGQGSGADAAGRTTGDPRGRAG